MKHFNVERKQLTLFRNIYAVILDKTKKEMISKVHVCNVFISYHTVLIDMLDCKN